MVVCCSEIIVRSRDSVDGMACIFLCLPMIALCGLGIAAMTAVLAVELLNTQAHRSSHAVRDQWLKVDF